VKRHLRITKKPLKELQVARRPGPDSHMLHTSGGYMSKPQVLPGGTRTSVHEPFTFSRK
jgi:hypothetical protein